MLMSVVVHSGVCGSEVLRLPLTQLPQVRVRPRAVQRDFRPHSQNYGVSCHVARLLDSGLYGPGFES